jgi:GDPmannose 4,6-dehydratase
MTKRALITGITGQDGSYMADLLLSRGYEVHGIVRRVALEDQAHRLGRIEHILDRLNLHAGSLESFPSMYRVLSQIQFDECYHFAAQSFVAESFSDGFSTMGININGTHYILAALKDLQPDCRFYFASSSEMFGKVVEVPQSETTSFHPRSPYGISKVAGYFLTQNYRESYDMFCCSGILFNHESPRRGFEFVTRKITSAAAGIKLGVTRELALGNLEAKRDWGHARDYVEVIHRILQYHEPEDFVIATGETHTVREFCEIAFAYLDLDYREYVRVDERFYRPAEVDLLKGDPSKAKEKLGWTSTVTFEDLIKEMVDADYSRISASVNPGAIDRVN